MAESSEELILEKMAELGFNKYESKTYITLLEHQEISAYEISKKSGVPQSKIYETVNRMVEAGYVIAQGENPVVYSPLPLSEFMSRHRSRLEKSLNILEEELHDFVEEPEVDYMWHMKGDQSCMEKVRDVIESANERLLVEVWENEVKEITPSLKKAAAKDVRIIIIYYGQHLSLPGEVFYHRLEGMNEEVKDRGRWLTAVADRSEAFFGSFGPKGAEAVWTQNYAFMLMAENFISHDIFIAEIYRNFSSQLEELFGPNLQKLRDKLDF